MTHEQIDADDVIDRYAAGTLDEATSAAFEEHYFACDECFARLESIEALRRAVRQSSGARVPVSQSLSAARWLPIAASLALAAGLGWMSLVKMPALRQEVTTLAADRDALKQALGAAGSAASAAPPPSVEANVAMVTLASERGVAAPTTVALNAAASHFVVVIEAPGSPSGRARLEVESAAGTNVVTVGGLVRNAQDVWTVSLPAASFPAGVYRLRLRADASDGALLGEYRISIIR